MPSISASIYRQAGDSQEGDDETIWISADEARSAFDAVIPDVLSLVDRKLADMTELSGASDDLGSAGHGRAEDLEWELAAGTPRSFEALRRARPHAPSTF